MATSRMLYLMKRDTVRPRDMPPALFCSPLDPSNLELACQLSATATQFAPRKFPQGVHRYTSVVEAATRREEWERQGSRRDG